MRTFLAAMLAVGLVAVVATPAFADEANARDIQAAVDSYLANSEQEANLVGGPGSAGYDSGFWIRGGDFLLRINLTLQARFEAFDWDNNEPSNAGITARQGEAAGDLSGFSLPRATVKFSGEAPCDINYYLELEFGHWGEDAAENESNIGGTFLNELGNSNFQNQSGNFDNSREAWIEWAYSDSFNFRMGQIKTPTTRQAMVAPELQQFVDVSMATAYTGLLMPGYTDRNRDHGFMVHGVFGCNNEFSYMVAVTNGDGGDSIRNVLDHSTSDNLAYSGRLNWAFLNAIGYEEGALRQQTCQWYGEVGVWGHYYADRRDKPHTTVADKIRYGADLALGYGGWSFTAAYTMGEDDDIGGAGPAVEYSAWLVQLGYHFPGTAWEVAARASSYDTDPDAGVVGNAFGNGAVTEFAFAINYYLNGHGNKLSLDASFISGDDVGSALIWDAYAGYANSLNGEEDAILIRFQWQLAL